MKVTVELIDDFFVEVDELNHTLKQRFEGKTKEGEPKSSERIIGYFPNLISCVERTVRLICLAENDNRVISMREYAEAAEFAFKRVQTLNIKPKVTVDDIERLLQQQQ